MQIRGERNSCILAETEAARLPRRAEHQRAVVPSAVTPTGYHLRKCPIADIGRLLILISFLDIIAHGFFPIPYPMLVGLRAAQREGISIVLEN